TPMSKPKRTMIMKTRTAVVTLVVALLWQLVIGDVSDVRCRWNTSCLLEGNFSVGDDVAIYWIRFPEILVHSFSYEVDRLKKQDKRFRGRTSLFKENIGKGNASLLLKDVVVGDEGRYMCRVGTLMGISDSFVNLHIEAPVTQIHIHCDGRRLICSSDRIFPRPELRWSTVPALGWLDLAGDALPDVEYVCDVNNSRSGSRVTAADSGLLRRASLEWRCYSSVDISLSVASSSGCIVDCVLYCGASTISKKNYKIGHSLKVHLIIQCTF
uniref:Ig-like domain-containing protein n=1 Tax=Hippocampus comes TaxID=109280 RepID=A0A3Q2Z3A7_HIPCM